MNKVTIFKHTTRFGLFLFAFSLPVSHVPAQFGLGIAVLGWLTEGVLNKNWQVQWHPFFIPLLLYLGWNVLSAGLSERPVHSLGALVDNEWPVLMMVMMYWTIREEHVLKTLVYVFLISSFVALIYAIWQVRGGVELYRGEALDQMGWGFHRAVGFYGFYLTFAAFAMTVFFYAAGFSFELRKWPFFALSGLSFLAVVGSFARSMWLSFIAAIPLFAFTRGRKTGLIVTATLLIILCAGVLSVPALQYRAESIVDPGQNQTRLNLWKTAVRVIEANPVLGVGEDNWDLVFPRYRVEGFYDTIVHPHNDYLTVLVSSGFPGFLAFCAMWIVSLRAGIRTVRGSNAPFIRAIALGGTFSLLGLLVGAMFQNYYGTFINCLGWWFVVGSIFTAGKLSQKHT